MPMRLLDSSDHHIPAAAVWRSIEAGACEHQTTNLGAGGSNPSGRAIPFRQFCAIFTRRREPVNDFLFRVSNHIASTRISFAGSGRLSGKRSG